jgi:predicted nuclease of restriction endonuclease-like RecB superfamily
MSRPHDSRLEAHLERDLRRLGSSWRIEREAAVVRAGTQLFFPDFALVSAAGRVLIEVVGYWTEEYLAKKAALLRAARAPMILCVDQRHARGELAADPRVLPFTKRVDASALLHACAMVLAKRES